MHPREQLVEIMNRIYYSGMTTLSGGNLSIRDQNGGIWITPSGIDKGSLRPDGIIRIKPDGTVIGPHKPSSELPFHRAIYEKRPDLRAVVHAHTPALVSFSITQKVPDTRVIPQANRVCGPVGYAPYALPGSEQLGESIAAAFVDGCHVVILENHGVAAAGENLLDAFHRLETLNYCARTWIKAKTLGEVSTLTDDQLKLFISRSHILPEFDHVKPSNKELELRNQIVEIVHRACDRYLMISTEGVVSARIDQGFLITPTGIDRRTVEEADIVFIKDGKRERNKFPSRSVQLHNEIYAKHLDINSIITAQSPNIGAYALSDADFDSKTIPESYVMLRDVPKIPFETLYQQPKDVAEMISLKTPVAIVKNDCVLVIGKSILEAFDRLEIAEFSAKALLDTDIIGGLVRISDSDLKILKEKFL